MAGVEGLLGDFRELDTTSVSDALDRLGLNGTCTGLGPVFQGAKAVGTAFTVSYIPAGHPPGTVGDFVDDVGPDMMLVLDNRGRTDCTVWGDLLTLVAQRRGLSGTVIDGVCRDAPGIIACRYPVFSRGCFMRTGKDRVEVAGINVPVGLGAVQVRPGDIVIGDDSGVVVVPATRAEEVLTLALEVAEAEQRIEQWIRAGHTLAEARSKEGYHRLQRGSPPAGSDA